MNKLLIISKLLRLILVRSEISFEKEGPLVKGKSLAKPVIVVADAFTSAKKVSS